MIIISVYLHQLLTTTSLIAVTMSIKCLKIDRNIIIKPGAPAASRRAWFLIITFVRECMRVCVCVCVRPRGHKLLVA